jgi:hypothetical protein
MQGREPGQGTYAKQLTGGKSGYEENLAASWRRDARFLLDLAWTDNLWQNNWNRRR